MSLGRMPPSEHVRHGCAALMLPGAPHHPLHLFCGLQAYTFVLTKYFPGMTAVALACSGTFTMPTNTAGQVRSCAGVCRVLLGCSVHVLCRGSGCF